MGLWEELAEAQSHIAVIEAAPVERLTQDEMMAYDIWLRQRQELRRALGI